MHNRPHDFIQKKKEIIFSLSFGFRQKQCTTHALIHLTDKIRDEIGQVTILVETFQIFKRPLIQWITIYYLKNQNTMVSKEFEIESLLRILVTGSSLLQNFAVWLQIKCSYCQMWYPSRFHTGTSFVPYLHYRFTCSN